ncbi:NAD(P)-binding protein [Schizopora paradoxa]|uniref:NAD(P)-binding protein n=1 Tax=Schizopora paradoxa TaxID=27342 RepID=A0A0H2RZI4_9AGAM|nr:NAD(P)-binding protein [Schizopora paradoxa]
MYSPAEKTSERSLVLITGASGYIGGYVAKDALKAGYSIRLTARTPKVETLRKEYGSEAEIVPLDDIVSGDYSEALEGVSAIIHLASPLPASGKHEVAASEHLRFSLDGTMNLLRQGAAMGVKKMIICSSILAVTDMDNMQNAFNSNHTYTAEDWNPTTTKVLLGSEHHPWWVYGASKAIAEREVWKFANEHPEIDFTVFQPGFVYGPTSGVSIPPRGSSEIPSTPFLLYSNIFKLPFKTGFPPVVPLSVDVRDCARAHVLALSAPPSTEVGRKRLLLSAPSFTWAQAVEHLRTVRPELRERLLSEAEINETYGAMPIGGVARVDCERAKEVLGFSEFISWQKMVEDCVDDLLEVEKGWKFD